MLECCQCKTWYDDSFEDHVCPKCGGDLQEHEEQGDIWTQQPMGNTPTELTENQSGHLTPGLNQSTLQFQNLMLVNFGVMVEPVFCPICNRIDCGAIMESGLNSRIGPIRCKHYPNRIWAAKRNVLGGIEKGELIR